MASMTYKLIRVDSDNPIKIDIETGTHVFGRGKLLAVHDKRISRKHGQLEVTDDALVVTALHQNPCFYKKAGSAEVQVLAKDESIPLSSGDKLGLLSAIYWFEVVRCLLSEYQNVSEDPPQNKAYGDNTESENAVSESTDKDEHAERVSMDVEKGIDFDKESEDEHSENQQNEPSTSNNYANETNIEEPGSSSLLSNDVAPSSSAPSEACSPAKRPHDTNEEESSGEVKKIKTESDEEPESKPGSSTDDKEVKPQLPNTKPVGLRERCMYGHSCYRRNPQHLAQFSHPRDADWGGGERAPCPWGGACGKRDPRHWRDHDHPPGTRPPPPAPRPHQPHQPQQYGRVVHRNGNIFYINAQTVNFYDDHFEADDSDGNSVDYDYEF